MGVAAQKLVRDIRDWVIYIYLGAIRLNRDAIIATRMESKLRLLLRATFSGMLRAP